MDIRKLQRAIVDGLEDVKAQDIKVFNTEHLSPLFERVILASGTSNRQTKALAASVRDAVRKAGFQVMRTEGEDNGEWIIVDCAAAVVHVMQPAIRQYYLLEEIWGEKPVNVKLGAQSGKLVKASEPQEDVEDAVIVKKPRARKEAVQAAEPVVKRAAAKKAAAKAPAKKAPAKKAAVRTGAAKTPAKKATTSKSPAAKTPGRKAAGTAAATRTVVVNKPVAKKVAGKKAPAKKAPANRAPAVKRVAAKKVAVKKVAAKKVVAKKAPRRAS